MANIVSLKNKDSLSEEFTREGIKQRIFDIVLGRVSGVPCFVGTRVQAELFFVNFQSGMNLTSFTRNYPTVPYAYAVTAQKIFNTIKKKSLNSYAKSLAR